ncbi:MAG: exosortase-associated EpsI family protein [Phycisphaerales bacterium]
MSTPARTTSGAGRLTRWWPIAVAAGLLVALPLALPVTVEDSPELDAIRARAATAIADVPYIMDGRWAGTDREVPAAAVELLNPNAILSREYRDLDGGGTFGYIVVHATDVRDMEGHYPPICYPASGYVEIADRIDETIAVSGRALPVREYAFERSTADGQTQRIRILNTFILPDGSTALDRRGLQDRAQRRALAARGMAQIQLVAALDTDAQTCRGALAALLNGSPEMLAAIGYGEPEAGSQEGNGR